jgi:hypothetical protein
LTSFVPLDWTIFAARLAISRTQEPGEALPQNATGSVWRISIPNQSPVACEKNDDLAAGMYALFASFGSLDLIRVGA